MDLSWWKYDARIDEGQYIELVLHLKRGNVWDKYEETIEKLFSITEVVYIPQHVNGIQNIEGVERIEVLNNLVLEKNEGQKSKVLMIYRYEGSRGRAGHNESGLIESRDAIYK
ncbi:hypothetical protein [Halobacillus salinus]|uniref:Uncharacterized protein n=1 Tax=Halobacillus salinus TaxID=192814 RepID=A0A4Z0H272_9BACI|nr:hypothetical protein [Halobacillus salinus]TGB03511.1 hypothetical protein E4663_00465 [Halobacillus salinus]